MAMLLADQYPEVDFARLVNEQASDYLDRYFTAAELVAATIHPAIRLPFLLSKGNMY